MKLTGNEIIKALECLKGYAIRCRECPYSVRFKFPQCQQKVAKDTIDFINHQNAQIEALIAGQETLQKHIATQKVEIENYKQIAETQQSLSMDRFFEIKRLTAEIERSDKTKAEFAKRFYKEGIKDVVERLKRKAFYPLGSWFAEKVVTESAIDIVAEEMVGDNNVNTQRKEDEKND